MSIVMLGLNFGASVVPYVATLLWDHSSLSYNTLPIIVAISMAAPIPLLFLTRSVNSVWLIGKDEKEKDEEAFPIKGEVA
jgi:hypothetical protein